MATRKAQIRLSGRFPAGTTVELREVAAGALPGGPPAGRVVGRAKTSRDSITVFDEGVEEGKRYQALAVIDGTPRVVNVTGKVPAPEATTTERPPVQDAGVLEDPFGTDDFDAADKAERRRLGDGAVARGAVVAPGNMPRQDEATDVLQRSNTPQGEAVPKAEGETVPYLDQADYTDGKTVQRSDTELGMATPIPDVPRTQEEARARGLVQASDTPVGEATPLRSGGPLMDRQAQDSPEEVVGGEHVAPLEGPGEVDYLEDVDDPRARLAALREAAAGDAGDVTPIEDLSDEQVAAELLERKTAAGEPVEERVEPERVVAADESFDAPDRPWTGYDDASADELKEAIGRKRSTELLEGAIAYEEANKNRSTVIAAARDRIAALG